MASYAGVLDIRRIPWRMRVTIAYVLGPLYSFSPSKIRKNLKAQGYSNLPSLKAITLFCRRYRTTRSISDRQRSGRRPILQKYHRDAINNWIAENRELSMNDLHAKLFDLFGVRVGRETVRKTIWAPGWRKKATRYCQLVRAANMPKRLVYALLCLVRGEKFEDVLFTDEASKECNRVGNLVFRRKDEASIISKVPKPKHPYKVHVWGGISVRGATSLCIFVGKLNSTGFADILTESLLPFARDVYPEGFRFMQDNDPKHTSNRTKAFLVSKGIRHWRTPPESPDMNPVEMIWSLLKRHLAKHSRPRDAEGLTRGIAAFWKTVTPEMCRQFISHLFKVIPQVILRGGAASGF